MIILNFCHRKKLKISYILHSRFFSCCLGDDYVSFELFGELFSYFASSLFFVDSTTLYTTLGGSLDYSKACERKKGRRERTSDESKNKEKKRKWKIVCDENFTRERISESERVKVIISLSRVAWHSFSPPSAFSVFFRATTRARCLKESYVQFRCADKDISVFCAVYLSGMCSSVF